MPDDGPGDPRREPIWWCMAPGTVLLKDTLSFVLRLCRLVHCVAVLLGAALSLRLNLTLSVQPREYEYENEAHAECAEEKMFLVHFDFPFHAGNRNR